MWRNVLRGILLCLVLTVAWTTAEDTGGTQQTSNTTPSPENPATDTTPSTENQATDTTPSTENPATDTTPSTENPATDTTPSTENPATDTTPSTENPDSNTTPSTENTATDTTPSTESPDTDTTPSTENPNTDTTPSTENPDTDTTPSTENPGTDTTPSTGNPNSDSTPSTENPNSDSTPSTENPALDTSLSTESPASDTPPSSEAPEHSTPSTETTEPPVTVPSTTPKSEYPTMRPDKPFILSLPFGNSNTTAVRCTATNCTYNTVENDVEQAFENFDGLLYIRKKVSSASRRKREADSLFTVEVVIRAEAMIKLTEDERRERVNVSLTVLNGKNGISVTEKAYEIAVKFARDSGDLCQTQDPCNTGYRCNNNVCYHLCDGHDCGDNGVCNAVVNSDGKAHAECVCNSGYEYKYSGPKCEDKEMGKAKVAAIVGGVLGTLSAILIIVIIYMYCRKGKDDDNNRGKYQLGGYSNNGYADREFDMKNVDPASP